MSDLASRGTLSFAPVLRIYLVCALSILSQCNWALAGQPYKCVGADGKITFTDQKCSADAAPQRIWDSHLGQPPQEAEQATGPGQPQAMQQNGTAQQTEGRGGYACSTAKHSWVQLSPCPHTLEEEHTTRISHSDGTSTTIESENPRLVHQDVLGHDAFCPQTLSADISSYDKNRMRDTANCH
jgi:hypothetical protein